ncbi:MAG: PBECR2 nuclease fold domain-containing protein [Acutalibacteraceae bacterium]
MKTGKIGQISEQVINALQIDVSPNTPIYIGETNIEHMKNRHYRDFEKYGEYIQEIITAPDFVGHNPKDNSIEYVKEFVIDNEYVKVAVRVSTNQRFFARSLYVLNRKRVQNFIEKGTLKPLTNKK